MLIEHLRNNLLVEDSLPFLPQITILVSLTIDYCIAILRTDISIPDTRPEVFDLLPVADHPLCLTDSNHSIRYSFIIHKFALRRPLLHMACPSSSDERWTGIESY